MRLEFTKFGRLAEWCEHTHNFTIFIGEESPNPPLHHKTNKQNQKTSGTHTKPLLKNNSVSYDSRKKHYWKTKQPALEKATHQQIGF